MSTFTWLLHSVLGPAVIEGGWLVLEKGLEYPFFSLLDVCIGELKIASIASSSRAVIPAAVVLIVEVGLCQASLQQWQNAPRHHRYLVHLVPLPLSTAPAGTEGTWRPHCRPSSPLSVIVS